MSTEIAVRQPSTTLARRDELTIEDMLAQVEKVQQVMKRVMQQDEHYGVIPGTGGKPTLLKPGAEKLCMLFRLDPQYHSVETYEYKHLTVKTTCTLYHIPTSERWGSGEGSCSTREAKYAYRKGSRHCPNCGSDAIIKGRAEYGGGWLCFAKKGGCGAKYKDGDAAIETQSLDRVANEDLADSYNTVLKMANKRALVAAVLNVTAASDIFTQDLEDMQDSRSDTAAGTTRRDSAAQERGGESDRPADAAAESSPQADRGSAVLSERLHAAVPAATDDEQERNTLIAEGSTLLKGVPLAVQRAMKKQYAGNENADVFTMDLAALSDLVKALRARATARSQQGLA